MTEEIENLGSISKEKAMHFLKGLSYPQTVKTSESWAAKHTLFRDDVIAANEYSKERKKSS